MTTIYNTSPVPIRGFIHRTLTRHLVLAFFILAYIWTWGAIAIAVLAMNTGLVTEDSPMIALLATIAPFGPAGAAVILTTATGGRKGLHNLFASLNPRRIGLGWYVVALIGPPLLFVLGEVAMYGVAPFVDRVEQMPMAFTRYLLNVLGVLVVTGIPEELGWRGVAQPRLERRYGPLIGTLLLGAGAALWHLPNALLRPGGLFIFGLQALYTVVIAVLLTWMYHHNHRSVLIVALVHAAFNASTGLLAAFLPIADPVALAQHIYLNVVAVVSIIALLLIVLTRGRLGYKSEQAAV